MVPRRLGAFFYITKKPILRLKINFSILYEN